MRNRPINIEELDELDLTANPSSNNTDSYDENSNLHGFETNLRFLLTGNQRQVEETTNFCGRPDKFPLKVSLLDCVRDEFEVIEYKEPRECKNPKGFFDNSYRGRTVWNCSDDQNQKDVAREFYKNQREKTYPNDVPLKNYRGCTERQGNNIRALSNNSALWKPGNYSTSCNVRGSSEFKFDAQSWGIGIVVGLGIMSVLYVLAIVALRFKKHHDEERIPLLESTDVNQIPVHRL